LWVQSLVRELRFHMPQGAAKIKKKKIRWIGGEKQISTSIFIPNKLFFKMKKTKIKFHPFFFFFAGWGEHHGICVLQHGRPPPPSKLLHRKGELYASKAFLKENLSVNTLVLLLLGRGMKGRLFSFYSFLYNLSNYFCVCYIL